MWFLFALLTTLAWGCADLFYKKGSDADDKLSHLKVSVMVGLVMGIHGIGYMLFNEVSFNLMDMIKYLPVSALYIISMVIGYFGLRYLELSISSPVQNSSGAITAILLVILFPQSVHWLTIAGLVLITGGVIGLGVLEKRAQTAILKADNVSVDPKYQIGVLAITFPILYAIFDALGTLADGIYLDELKLMSADAALLAYEFTWLIVAIVCFIYIRFVRKERFNILKEPVRATAAILETAGQFFYVFAMTGNAVISAPLIASYSIVSVILSRIFLKEKLNKQQYLVITIVMIGIAILGFAEEM